VCVVTTCVERTASSFLESEAAFDGENEERKCWSLQGAIIICECDHCHIRIKMHEKQVNRESRVLLHSDTTSLLGKVLHEEQEEMCKEKAVYYAWIKSFANQK